MIVAFIFGVHRYTGSFDRRLLLSPLILVILVAGIDALGHYIVATHPDAVAALQTKLAKAMNDPSHPYLSVFPVHSVDCVLKCRSSRGTSSCSSERVELESRSDRFFIRTDYCSRNNSAGSAFSAFRTGPATERPPVNNIVSAAAPSTNGSWAEA
jgi:hypothetical protein